MRTQKNLEFFFLLKKEKKVKEEKGFSSLLGRTEEGTDPSFLFSQQKRRYPPNLSLFVKACLLRFYQLPLVVKEINEFSSPSREREGLVRLIEEKTDIFSQKPGRTFSFRGKEVILLLQVEKRTTSVERKNDTFSSEREE